MQHVGTKWCWPEFVLVEINVVMLAQVVSAQSGVGTKWCRHKVVADARQFLRVNRRWHSVVLAACSKQIRENTVRKCAPVPCKTDIGYTRSKQFHLLIRGKHVSFDV